MRDANSVELEYRSFMSGILKMRGARYLPHFKSDGERALFNVHRVVLDKAILKGPGESPAKGASDILVLNSSIRARYAFWENRNLRIYFTRFYSSDRAPLWYTRNFVIDSCRMESPKSLRMCQDMTIRDSSLKGTESLWQISQFDIDDFTLESYYPFLECSHGVIKNLHMKGKYSFQHCRDILIENSELETKDAFWHSRNITVKNSVLKGEYIGWYASDLNFINCRFEGTQPFVESRRLTFVNCTFDASCDRSFEASDVTLIDTAQPDVYKPRSIIREELAENLDLDDLAYLGKEPKHLS